MGFFQVLKIIFQFFYRIIVPYCLITHFYVFQSHKLVSFLTFRSPYFFCPSNIQKYVHLQSFLHLMMWKRGNFSKLTLFLKIFHRIIFLFLINEFFFLSQIFSRFCWNVVVQIVTSLFSLPKNVQLQKF